MLVTFEGIDGSGKSTQAERLVERLRREGEDPLFVREPGGTPLSEKVRALLLDEALHVVPLAELLLFSAARAQLVAERIRPALAAGRLVLCDRFYDSTTAYQGGGRGVVEAGWLQAFNRQVTGGLVPDRTYLIALTPEAARSRRLARGERDRMEAAEDGFHERVFEAYETLARAEPARIRRLDGSLPIDALHEEIWADLQALRTRPAGTRRAGAG